MAVPDPVRLRGSCRCIEHMATSSHLRGSSRCIEQLATCSHLRLRRKHLDIRDHVHVDGARSILGRKELGGDDDDRAVPGFVHAHDDGNDDWGCHEPEDRRANRQLGGKTRSRTAMCAKREAATAATRAYVEIEKHISDTCMLACN